MLQISIHYSLTVGVVQDVATTQLTTVPGLHWQCFALEFILFSESFGL